MMRTYEKYTTVHGGYLEGEWEYADEGQAMRATTKYGEPRGMVVDRFRRHLDTNCMDRPSRFFAKWVAALSYRRMQATMEGLKCTR
jgi:hypothetical protein